MSRAFHVRARSNDELERESLALRAALGILDITQFPDLHQALDHAGKRAGTPLSGLVIETLGDTEMDRIDAQAEAFVEFDPPRLVARRRVMDGASRRSGRDRFTIMHELSHIWLGHRGERKFRSSAPPSEADYVPPPHKNSETQADRCASYALMPTSLARSFESAEALAHAFGVSRRAAELRLDLLSRILPKKPLAEVTDFLAAQQRKELQSKRPADQRRRSASLVIERIWQNAAIAPDSDPTKFRLCSKGNLIKKSEHAKHRSPLGWCERAGLVVSYRSLNAIGLGESQPNNFGDAPCHECGNFTLVRNGTCLKCDTCGGTSGCS